MQAMFLDTRESNRYPAEGSSAQLCEKIFCLCHRLEVPSQTCFDALLLANNYLGPAGISKITPNSKKRVQEPIVLVSAASLLAALTASERPETSENAVLEAASSLFNSSLADKVTLETVKKSAEEILLCSMSREEQKPAAKGSSSLPPPTTAQLIEDLHAALPNNLSSQIDIKVAYLLLELLCLANGGSQCTVLLQKGGALAAGACLAAAHCIAFSPSPLASHLKKSSEILSAISTLTGFPDEVIFSQSQSLVHQALSPG